MARLTVSPTCWASSRQTGRLSCTTSSRALAAPASRTMPTPSRNLPRAASWVTSSRRSSAASSRDAVDLCTSSSRATSVTPASPSRARISRIATARSTDWTDCAVPGPPASLLLIAQRYPQIDRSSSYRGHGRMGRMTGPADVHDAFDLARLDPGQPCEAPLLRIEKFVALYATTEVGYDCCGRTRVRAHAVLPGQAGDRVRGVQL